MLKALAIDIVTFFEEKPGNKEFSGSSTTEKTWL
jgi:hypothetical protein